MSTKKDEKLPPLQEGLLIAMRALDNQINKAVERRTPAEREVHGVEKWQPLNDRVELVASVLLEAFADGDAGLDALLVLAQAAPKALSMVIDELGLPALGDARANYCRQAMAGIADDARRSMERISTESTVM
jgi:hypothetical protein